MHQENTDKPEVEIGYPTKIATCCHCGSKTMLTLGKGRHELACANCGAPLRQMKMLPKAMPAALPAVTHQPQVRQLVVAANPTKQKVTKPKKSKKRKAWFKDWAEDVFDLVEDIFD